MARRLEETELVIVATPDYLRKHGTPRRIADLTQHDCIQFVLPSTGLPMQWLLRDGDRELEVATTGTFTCSDDVLGCVTLARHGAGVTQTFRYAVQQDLEQGRLRELLKAHGGCTRPFTLIYPGNRHMPLRMRVFIDFLTAKLSKGQESTEPVPASLRA